MGIFNRIGTRLDLMQEMFRQTGALKAASAGVGARQEGLMVDPFVVGSNASSLRQAVHSCASCDNVAACQSFLEEGVDQGLTDRSPPQFCPNAALQTQLKRIKA